MYSVGRFFSHVSLMKQHQETTFIVKFYLYEITIFFFISQAYVLLSGLSPFAGSTDLDTLKNVKACSWVFDEEAFMNVSEEGKDFIRKLLIKQKEKRMNAHECLQHAWLTGDHR